MKRQGEANQHGLYMPKIQHSKKLEHPTVNHDVPVGEQRRKQINDLRAQCEPIPDRPGWYRLPRTTFECSFKEAEVVEMPDPVDEIAVSE